MVDGKFYTDAVADQAVRDACAKGSSQAAPQSPESAMEALGFKPKPPAHDEARSDTITNHPTRPETFRGLESGGFQGWEFKGLGVRVVRGLFAASLVHNARGVSAALRAGGYRGVLFERAGGSLPNAGRLACQVSFVRFVVSARAGLQPSV